MPHVRQELVSVFRELRELASRPEEWVGSPEGTDLWIDGLVALESVDERQFGRCLDACLDYFARLESPLDSLAGDCLALRLEAFDAFLEASAEAGEGSFWQALAVGICLARALGATPRVVAPGTEVINDTLMVLLSPSYRSVRYASYNAGIRVLGTRGRKAPVFRPELGHFLVVPPVLLNEQPPRFQFYTLNHDCAHIVLFEDTYLRPVGSPALTASLLLNAEETVCTIDLLLAREMRRFQVDFQAFQELIKLEVGRNQTGGELSSVLLRASEDEDDSIRYQIGLKAAAQRDLTLLSPLSRQIGSGAVPPEIHNWFHPDSQYTHAWWAEELAGRVWNPAFQRLVSLLPPLPGCLEGLLLSTRDVWRRGELTIRGGVPEPSPAVRRNGIAQRQLRFLVIRAAEAAVELEQKGAAPPPLLEDLTAWALGVVDDYVRVRQLGRVPDGAFAAHAAAVRQILVRYAVPDPEGRLAALFEDPIGWEAL